jgi:RNA polymerase sigma-70 factor (ECF subfamily)
MNGLEQTELLARAKDFDLQALEKIYDTFSPALYAYAFRLLGDPLQAEDCVAETFYRFLGALKAGRGPDNYLQAYIYRIAHNWITDQYRRQPPPPIYFEDDLQVIADDHPENETAEKMEQIQVRAALYRLTPDQRQVIMLRFIEGWENEAVAAALGRPVGAVKALQHRALSALRRMLLKSSLGWEDKNAFESVT